MTSDERNGVRTPWPGAGWLRDRLGAAGPPGALAASALVLMVGVTLLVLVMWMLGLLAKSGAVAGVDRPLYDWFVSHRAGWATTALSGFTGIGSYAATGLVSAVAGIGLALYRREALPLLLLATVPVEKYLQLGIAALVQAPRRPAAGAAWTVVAGAAFMEGYSRLYLGRHWIADVIGGWVFGALLLAVLLAAATLLPLPSGQRLGSACRGWASQERPQAHDRW